MDTHPRLDAAFLCTCTLENEGKLYGPRTSHPEFHTREMACRTRSKDRRLTLQPTETGEHSLSNSVGFEPGPE